MADSIRDLIVSLSFNAGNFSATATNIKQQIKNVESEFNALGGKVDGFANTLQGRNAKIQNLNDKLKLQTDAVKNYEDALKTAQTALANASAEGQMAAAKKVSDAETKLNNAKADVKVTVDEIARLSRELNGLKLTNLGSTLSTMGKQMQTFGRRFSMYVGAPLAALGVKSYNLAADYENAMAQIQVATGGTEEEMLTLEEQMLGMTERLPISFTELATLMTTLAQANVPTNQLAQVAEVMVGLGSVTDVGAAESAKGMIQFLTVLGEGYGGIGNMASALAVLGTNSVSTGSEIFEMAQRMVATGNLAGMTAVDILSLATGFSSLGINAEAGGSAASKLMKAMTLAATTGEGLYDVVKDGQVVAQGFADVMGMTGEQFTESWSKSPADTMLAFFNTLQNANETSQGEVFKMLQMMDITEIRMSNLVASAASNPALFAELITMGKKAWDENAALAEKTKIAYETTTNQGVINMNKIENAGADVGENVKDAVQPIIDTVSNLVSEFGKLDEDTQSRWVKVAGALVLLGPAALGIGKVVSSVGSLVTNIGKIQSGDAANFSALTSVLTNPVTWGLVAGVGVVLLTKYLDDLPTKVETIALSLKDIKINIDPNLLEQTLYDIAEVQAASDALDKDKMAQYASEAQLVKAGYGTQDMFGHALGYEQAMYEQNLALDMAPGIAAIAEKNAAILAADSAGDAALAASLTAERNRMAKEQAELAEIIRANYQAQVEALVSGMMESQPEAKAALEKANDAYGLIPTYLAMNKEFYSSKQYEQYGVLEKMYTQDFLNKYFGGKTLAELVPKVAGIFKYADVENLFIETERVINQAILDGTYTTNEGELGYNLINQLLGAGVLNNIDMTKVQGALAGMLKTIDMRAAVTEAGPDIKKFGKYLNEGLAGGITENSGIASATMKNIRDDILADLRSAFEMKSPSKLMAREGENISKGIAEGITQAIPIAVRAMNDLGAQLQAEAAVQGALAAAAYAAAFKSGLGGSSGYSGGTSGSGSKGSGASYSATSNLNGNVIIQGGVDARTLARLLANENMRQLRGGGVRS